jgi:putative hydrolase of the HAD superfamily
MTTGRSTPRNFPGDAGPPELWLFDLDNTLYPAGCDLFGLIERRMGAFIAETFGLTPEAARERQKRYFQRYGTTLRGLMVEHGIDPHRYLAFVHDIDLSSLSADPRLERALAGVPGRKLIFTNASRHHARRVLARLGLERHFEAIHDIIDAGFRPKPDPAAYAELPGRYGFDPARACMVEDMARNLPPAAALGMTTVWVRTGIDWSAPGPGDHQSIHHITDDLAEWLAAAGGGVETGGGKTSFVDSGPLQPL